jgi:16S rRNA (guanine527-N7)-methyltransferase
MNDAQAHSGEQSSGEQGLGEQSRVLTAQVEIEPAAAATLAGDQLPVLRQFAADLGRRGEELGLIGPLELPRLWTRHLLNSALIAPLIRTGAKVADIGTGGGMPGLILAIVRPDAEFILIEPMERRIAWLAEQIARLGLSNVQTLRGRAEEFHGVIHVDQVTARAVTALRTLIPMTAPLLREHGEFVLLKGASVEAEIVAAQKAISKFQVRGARSEILGEGILAESTRVFRATVERGSRGA